MAQKEAMRFTFIIEPAHKQALNDLRYSRRIHVKELMSDILESYFKANKKELAKAKRSK